MIAVLAHAGHWIVNILYAVPVLVVVVAIAVSVIRERRRGDDEPEDREPAAPRR